MNHIIILAGGKGTRMRSDLPKVLHSVKGVPIINRLLSSISPICARPTIIVGYGADQVIASTGNAYEYARQEAQLGTGHAIMCAKESLQGRAEIERIVVLNGDHPLVKADTVNGIINSHVRNGSTVTLGTFTVPDFDGVFSVFNNFGRILKDAEQGVDRIVEFKDATEAERGIKEVNLNYYCFDAGWLWKNIDLLKSNNAAGEFYLTDMVHIAKEQGKMISAYAIADMVDCLGINTPEQLKLVEEAIS
jgi:bifunctional UDP-N-acetylglucosamine pyrophosphorylase/glucosamine-1-phosphate N-acetyltransferase